MLQGFETKFFSQWRFSTLEQIVELFWCRIMPLPTLPKKHSRWCRHIPSAYLTSPHVVLTSTLSGIYGPRKTGEWGSFPSHITSGTRETPYKNLELPSTKVFIQLCKLCEKQMSCRYSCEWGTHAVLVQKYIHSMVPGRFLIYDKFLK